MKRAELKVGDRLYHDTQPGWALATYGGAEVEVLAVTPHISSKYSTVIREADKGLGVLVQRIRHDGEPGRRDVVQLSHLRGPWAATKALVQANREAANEAAEVRRITREANAEELAALVLRLAEQTGIKPYAGPYNRKIELSTEELAVIVVALEARS
jgi:hypothetical protein